MLYYVLQLLGVSAPLLYLDMSINSRNDTLATVFRLTFNVEHGRIVVNPLEYPVPVFVVLSIEADEFWA